MEYCVQNRANCIRQYNLIEKQFIKHKLDFNTLLQELVKYEGIGVTIATGLIWTAYKSKVVPFDKYTTTWSLEKGYIKTNKISNDYKKICGTILKELKSRRKKITVEEFVRESLEKTQDFEWSISPE